MDIMSINFAFGGALGGGSEPIARLKDKYANICSEALSWLADTPAGVEGHGWMELPDIETYEIKQTSDWLRAYDAVIHVGIGGSALGNLMIHQSILGDYLNSADLHPDFYLADNPDPAKIKDIWNRVSGKKVALVGVSKSGSTAETMSQFLWFRDMMLKANMNADKEDILVITDPKNGIFRSFAETTGCRALELPPSVGGRYSVLCPAGLYSAYLLGIDIDALLDGAKKMRELLLGERSFDKNPAMVMASLSCFHEKAGRPMSVIMPYSSRMSFFAEWFAQLWGESLGKNGMGTTPIRALGAIDQHSQVQLYTEGSDDKLFTIINIDDRGEKILAPSVTDKSLSPLAYMDGADIGRMLSLEAKSTSAAILKAGRPVVWVELGSLDEATLGGLVFFYEFMTALTGRMMGINPFDQPGVEQGKKYTYGLMGRSGYEKDSEEALKWFGSIEKDTICL